jgi:phytoene synthase
LSDSHQISKKSKSNFYYTFFFLSKKKNKAIQSVYAFCRISDDIVDSTASVESKRDSLNNWRLELKKAENNESSDPILKEIYQVNNDFSIPWTYYYELLDGMELDIEPKTPKTVDDLINYCYLAASTVGLICIYIFGFKNERSKTYAINLGIALQLSNIIRDIYQDKSMNRYYIPNSIYAMNHLEDRLDYNPKLKLAVNSLYIKALEYYQKADDNLFNNSDLKHFTVAQMMRNLYFRILEKCKREDFNYPNKSIKLSKLEKLYILFRTIL